MQRHDGAEDCAVWRSARHGHLVGDDNRLARMQMRHPMAQYEVVLVRGSGRPVVADRNVECRMEGGVHLEESGRVQVAGAVGMAGVVIKVDERSVC